MAATLKLFIKSGCGWCDLAEDWLKEHGYPYSVINVTRDRTAFDEMIRLSGQRLAPTLQVGELILPDFGPEELAQFLKKHSITP